MKLVTMEMKFGIFLQQQADALVGLKAPIHVKRLKLIHAVKDLEAAVGNGHVYEV